MLNLFDFPEGAQLQKPALRAAQNILKLKKRAQKSKVPVIYVNDNLEHWKSDWRKIYEICVEKGRRGREIALLLKPGEDDYFILKPKHSAFYSTTFEVLLKTLKIETLVLTGVAGNICVLFTANDAHMREYKVIVPKDCTASNRASDTTYMVRQLNEVFGISTALSTSLRF